MKKLFEELRTVQGWKGFTHSFEETLIPEALVQNGNSIVTAHVTPDELIRKLREIAAENHAKYSTSLIGGSASRSEYWKSRKDHYDKAEAETLLKKPPDTKVTPWTLEDAVSEDLKKGILDALSKRKDLLTKKELKAVQIRFIVHERGRTAVQMEIRFPKQFTTNQENFPTE